MFAANSPDFLVIMFGVWRAGLAAVPINAKLHGAEASWIVTNSGCRLTFASPGLATQLGAHLRNEPACEIIEIGSASYRALFEAGPAPCAPRAADDLAWLFYTSGTTGKPKGAMLTHGVLAAASFAYVAEVDHIAPGNPILHAAPISHGSGLYMMAHVMAQGVNVVPESGTFDPQEIFALLRAWPRTSLFAAPTMIKRMTQSAADCDPSTIRTIVWGGAPMYVEDAIKALDRFGPCFAQIYGQGESPMTITTLSKREIAERDHPEWFARLGTAGRAFSCIEVKIVDSDDRKLPAGEVGEIVCRGPTVMSGYWNNASATAKALRDGWLYTGDIGALDAQGYLTLKDRSKDLIISGGSNIYPREVEEVLLEHPGVQEASVIGRRDDDWGEIVVAYVVGDAQASELDELCLRRIARFKRPKHYVRVDALPKNNYGKILKSELRALDAGREVRKAT